METVRSFLTEVAEGDCNILALSRKELTNGKDGVTCTMQRKRAMPERMESPARAHTFHDAAGFVAYLNGINAADPAKENMVVMADVECEEWEVVCILDENARNGFEVIRLRPAKHPVFVMLEETLLDVGTMSMARLALAVMRNRAVIVDTPQVTAKDLAMIMQQITVATETKACTGVGKHAVNGVMVVTEIKGGPVDELVELPDTITVKLPIYLNTEPVQFGLDLTIGIDRGEPVAVIDAPELVVGKFEVFEEMIKPIKAMEGVFVSYGRIQTADWKYNK